LITLLLYVKTAKNTSQITKLYVFQGNPITLLFEASI